MACTGCDERSPPGWIANESPACYAHRNHVGPNVTHRGKEHVLPHETCQQSAPHESTGRCLVQAQHVHRVRNPFPMRC